MDHLDGEWSLLRWNAQSRVLAAAVSANLHDPMRFASDGRHVAIAPDVRRLGTLSWTDLAFDPVGMALTVARSPLRQRFLGDRTILRHVNAVEPGTLRQFSFGRPIESITAPPLAVPPRWKDSFDEAITAVELTARSLMRGALARHDSVAVMLSGGLDSSVLAWLAAEERQEGQKLFCVTSTAPAGSGLIDERAQSQTIADRLGLPVTFICPDSSTDPYRPSREAFAHADGPPLSPRHYLYNALLEGARQRGAEAIMDGQWGEASITRKAEMLSTTTWLRYWLRPLHAHFSLRANNDPSWDAGFHVKLARDIRARLRIELQTTSVNMSNPVPLHRDAQLGFAQSQDKMGGVPTSAAVGNIRHLLPYRDRQLCSLVAAMPARFATADGLTRAIARTLLKDRLPDAIRLQTQRFPFSPDYGLRLQHWAQQAAERIDIHENTAAAEWIDLAWLRQSLRKLSCSQTTPTAGQFKVQMTAMFAEFFLYWMSPQE
jgi:asparagine synthase (glutamine-hydrolysing)